jgi:hypothetical protein
MLRGMEVFAWWLLAVATTLYEQKEIVYLEFEQRYKGTH